MFVSVEAGVSFSFHYGFGNALTKTKLEEKYKNFKVEIYRKI